jgi:hypothetical protein
MIHLCSVNQICPRPRSRQTGLPRFLANAAHAGGDAFKCAAMKEIQLSNSPLKALVDDEDFNQLSKYKWHYSPGHATGYAKRNPRKCDATTKRILMHRVILNTPDGLDTDHINGNGLDNRRRNLRAVTHAENLSNTKAYRNNSTGFKGVTFHKKVGKFQACISINGKNTYLGLFKTASEANAVCVKKRETL